MITFDTNIQNNESIKVDYQVFSYTNLIKSINITAPEVKSLSFDD